MFVQHYHLDGQSVYIDDCRTIPLEPVKWLESVVRE